MLDPKLLRRDGEMVKAALQRRHFDLNMDFFLGLETRRRELQQSTESLQSVRNHKSKEIGIAKSQGQDASELLSEMGQLSQQLKDNEKALADLQGELLSFQSTLPNLLHDDVPDGKDEGDNVETKRWGDIPSFSFEPRDHVTIGEQLGCWISSVQQSYLVLDFP